MKSFFAYMSPIHHVKPVTSAIQAGIHPNTFFVELGGGVDDALA